MDKTNNVMARVVRRDYSCPHCGHGKFIVSEIQHNIFFTNNYGEIIDSNEDYDNSNCTAHCCNCHHNFKAISTPIGFIPVTNLSYIIYMNSDNSYISEIENQLNKVIKEEDRNNPFVSAIIKGAKGDDE